MKRICIAVMLTAAAVLPGIAQLKTLKPGFNLFSKEQDVQLGKQAEAQVNKNVHVVHNAEVENYLNQLGGRLAKSPRAGGFPFSFHLVYDKNVNAFALPGGPVFINTGLFAVTENEAQLAGVLAHEMSHVALRHGTNQLSKQRFIQIPALIADAALGNNALAQLGINAVAGSALLRMSRTDEAQADYNGTQIMADAGYNPIEMARFFEKLESQTGNPGRIAQFLSDHPNPGNRVQAVEDEIQYMPQRSYDANTGQFPHIKEVVAHLAPPPGVKSASVAQPEPAPHEHQSPPSSTFREYRGKSFSFSYPDNWQVASGADSNSVSIAGTGYKITQSYYYPTGDTIHLKSDTANLIQQLQKQDPQLQMTGDSRAISVGGKHGLETSLRSGEESDLLVTVPQPEGLFYLLLAAPVGQPSQS
ncbi:MAG: M48 family metallopeptidase, partial [Bryobacteraceae bacterium]